MFNVIKKSFIRSNCTFARNIRLFETQHIDETIFQVSRKYIVNTESDGFVIKSPYKSIELPRTTIDRYVWSNIQKWPNHVAIECSATGKKYTFAELRDRCAALAIRLRKKLGERDTVAICLPNIPGT